MNNFCGSGKVCVNPKSGRTALNTDFVKFIVEIEKPKGKDGKQSFDRINVGCWGAICKYAQYIENGDEIEFTGPLSTAAYQKNGQWVNTWEIAAKSIRILKKSVGDQLQPSQVPQPQPAPTAMPPTPVPPPTVAPPEVDESMLPFDIMGGYYG